MTLGKLADAIAITPSPMEAKRPIRQLTQRSDEAGPDHLFVCIRGQHADGHRLAPDAYRRGCRCFVAEQALSLPSDATVLRVKDSRRALGLLAAAFFGNPSRQLSLIGITGTKGKTTTARMLSAILNDGGIPTGYIGTNGMLFGDLRLDSPNTTPDPITLQRTLRHMLERGARAVALEVSSQALLQHRVDGCSFETLLFTNFSPDHIGPGEHTSLAEYLACKHRLFTDFPAVHAIFSIDSPQAAELQRNCAARHRLSVSSKRSADAMAKAISATVTDGIPGISFCYSTERIAQPIHLPLIGKQNADNALLALTAAHRCYSVPPATAAGSLSHLAIEGRSEVIPLSEGAIAVIDYAHNGESLSCLLRSLRDYRPSRLTVLFGSVGERTQLRRRELGRVAATLADLAILTSDNPGNESPDAIIDEIATAFEGTATPYLRCPDRAEAIAYAVRHTIPGEILVLAGKGHEGYQLIGREKRPFSERALLLELLSAPPTALQK